MNPDVIKEAAKLYYLDTHDYKDVHFPNDDMIPPQIFGFIIQLVLFTISSIVTINISQFAFAFNLYCFEINVLQFIFYAFTLEKYLSILHLKCKKKTDDYQEQYKKIKFKLKVLYDLYNNSQTVCYINLRERKNESIDQISLYDNNEITYNKETINIQLIWWGAVMCIFKSSNLFRITILKGMYEDDQNEINQVADNNSSLNESLLNNLQSNVEYFNYHNANGKKKCYNQNKPRHIWYTWIVGIVICAMQISYCIYQCISKTISWILIFAYIINRIIFLPKIIAYNLIDLVFYPKKIWNSFKDTCHKVIFIFLLAYYFLMIIITIVHSSKPYKFANIKNATFIEDNELWFKNGQNQTFSPESFCFIKSPLNNLFKTEDYAMFTTLPRLYSFTNDGKCFIKPSMRGLFNSTMKYIFGKNYEQDEIYIFCKKMSHYPFLVITSEKILNSTLENFAYDDHIIYLKKQFNIKNEDYFQNKSNISNLPNEGKKLLDQYQICVKMYGTENCEQEWDTFTQFYWPNVFNDFFANISGFERYQITVNFDLVFQPRFITSSGKLMSGTHYIVGGSFEDKWGIGFLIEAASRKYTPIIFQALIPFYKVIRNICKEISNQLEYINNLITFTVPIIKPGIMILSELYSQFNFSHEALFSIGHSVGGTLMKGVSYYTDIRGIAFESSDAENTVKLNLDPKFNISKKSTNNIANIYSINNKFSGLDDDSYLNGGFIKGYWALTVYKTACLTAITCSKTMKYVPFCKQTFSNNKSKSEKEFNQNLNAYLNQYGFQ